MVHGKYVVGQPGKAVWIGGGISQAGGDAGENRSAAGLRGLPVVGVAAVAIHRIRPNRIVFQAIRGADGRAEIQKGIHVDLIKVNPEAATYHKTAAGVVGKTKARG